MSASEGEDNQGLEKQGSTLSKLSLPSNRTDGEPPPYSEFVTDNGERVITWEPYGTMPISKFNRRVWRNVIILSFAFLCNYVSYGGLANLQSSLHIQQGMGTICTSIRYIALVLSCVFVPKLMIRLITHKWTIAVSFVGFLIWEAANGYGIWATMVPASIINGIFVAPLWAAQGSYYTTLAREYAQVNGANEDTTIALFFGVYYAFYTGSAIFGNVISSTVLSSSPPENYTGPTDEEVANMCGMNDCPWNTMNNTNLEKPDKTIVWTLVGIYMCIGLCAILITSFLVDHLPRHLVKESGLTVKQEFWSLILCTLRHTIKKKQLLLIPITVYMGLEESYFGAEFNRSWTTCSLGIWMIGLTNIPFGISAAIVSFSGGRLVKVIGRVPIFLTGLVIDVSIQVFLATWTVDPNKEGVFYGIPTLWGVTDAIWVTLIGTTYGIFFAGESEAAFSNHMMFWCIGLAIGFGYSSALCSDVKLYILFSMLWVGIGCYLGAEYVHRKTTRKIDISNENEKPLEMSQDVKSEFSYQNGVIDHEKVDGEKA